MKHFWTSTAVGVALISALFVPVVMGAMEKSVERGACEDRGGVYLYRDAVCVSKEAVIKLESGEQK